ncbi:helix-turn-helix domain-containing protein, partial [Pseudomonas fragi]|uniref:helix-turn-helix domain-containing protein n=1 Tax=Pseudomonas fragi TaxID=296 RepID=UPI0021D1DA9F
MSYTELSVEERATIQISHAQGFSLRRIACLINRSPSTISRELRRNRDVCGGYSAHAAQQQMQARRQVCRPKRKLLRGGERFELVAHMLRERLSPEQIAGKRRSQGASATPHVRCCHVYPIQPPEYRGARHHYGDALSTTDAA